jgi:CelD/BcsL family acetyltransferase involved in cellulose biosynthesis
MDFRLEVFQGRSGFEALAADWHTLFDALSQPSYAQLWDWHRAHLDALAVPDNVYFGALYDGDAAIAIVPLELSMGFGRLGVRVASLPRPDLHSDILVHPRALQHFDLMGTLEAIRARIQKPWDVTRLGPTPEHSTVTQVFQKTAVEARWPRRFRFSEIRGGSDALETGQYEALLGGLSKNFRGGLRKSRNKLAKLEGVTVQWARTPEALEAALPRFLEVEASGWKGAAGTAITSIRFHREFYSGLMRSLGPSGRGRINLMFHGEKVIGGQLGVVLGERYYLLKIGYDESYRQEAPGNMLLERLLQEIGGDRSIRYLDLVSGTAWHDSWKPLRCRLFMHYIFHNLPLGMAVWAAIRGRKVLRPLVQELRDQAGRLLKKGASIEPHS